MPRPLLRPADPDRAALTPGEANNYFFPSAAARDELFAFAGFGRPEAPAVDSPTVVAKTLDALVSAQETANVQITDLSLELPPGVDAGVNLSTFGLQAAHAIQLAAKDPTALVLLMASGETLTAFLGGILHEQTLLAADNPGVAFARWTKMGFLPGAVAFFGAQFFWLPTPLFRTPALVGRVLAAWVLGEAVRCVDCGSNLLAVEGRGLSFSGTQAFACAGAHARCAACAPPQPTGCPRCCARREEDTVEQLTHKLKSFLGEFGDSVRRDDGAATPSNYHGYPVPAPQWAAAGART